jgi:hypothetical protein
MNREANPEILLFRTFSRAPEKEFEILSNNRKDDNILTTPSTLIIPEIRFSSISSMQETENRWKNKPNLVFQPTTKESLSRTGTTMVLCCPASLHTCRTGDLITHYDAENKAITKPLFKRFKEFAEYLKTEWEKDATRDGKNLGMYDKYTELPLHDDLQGKQLYEQGYDFIDSIKKAIPEKGHELYKYVIQETEKNISKEKQDKIFESHKKYTKFLNNTNKTNLSPNIIKACKKYEDYLKNFTGNLPESYFDIIGDELYQGMRQEIIDSYEKYINNGLRHNEFIGRLFPWEIRSIEIGHVNNKQDKKDVLKHIQIANKNCQEFVELRKNLLKEIEVDGFGCYLIKEFIDAKNDILSHNNQDKLSDD